MLNCLRICRPTLSVERNRRLNGARCWLQKPGAISAHRRRPWLVSACLALLGGSTGTNAIGYFPHACRTTSSVGKKLNKDRRKKSRFRFFRFLAKNRDFRFRIRESSITRDNAVHARLATFTVTWQQRFRTCRSTHLLELSLLAVFIGGNESTRERTFRESKFQGAKVPGNESSTPGTFPPGSEWSWERKVHNSSYRLLKSCISHDCI